jgi:hypothetical protein
MTPQSDEVRFHSIQHAFEPDDDEQDVRRLASARWAEDWDSDEDAEYDREQLGNTFEIILFSLCVVVLALVIYSILGGTG